MAVFDKKRHMLLLYLENMMLYPKMDATFAIRATKSKQFARMHTRKFA